MFSTLVLISLLSLNTTPKISVLPAFMPCFDSQVATLFLRAILSIRTFICFPSTNKWAGYQPAFETQFYLEITSKTGISTSFFSLRLFRMQHFARDQTVSQRSKLRSCTAFLGEQPNPWNQLQLQDAIMFQSRDCYQPHPSGPEPYVNVSIHTARTEQ